MGADGSLTGATANFGTGMKRGLEICLKEFNDAGGYQGRKVEIPFQAQLALSTNLRPAELLDEAYLRRLSYKVLMPDPTWEMWCRIFERERERLAIPPDPGALEMISTLYSGRPLRGNHPRDLLERLVDVSSARGVQPKLTPELVEAAWHTLFIAS